MMRFLWSYDSDAAKEVADIILLSQDGYLREQDWESLQAQDVQQAGQVTALLFGRAERGERSKTGHGQGLLVDYPATRHMLAERLRGKKPTDKIFGLSQQSYRKWWYLASEALGIRDVVGRPHNVRHTGPSRDVYIRYRTLKEVQRRGRWRVDSSVLRYSKTHEYAKALARAPADLMQQGGAMLSELGERTATPQC